MSVNGEDKKPAAADGVHINLKDTRQISREGYRVDGDHHQPKPINPLRSSGDQPNSNNASGLLSPNSDIPETVSGQPSNEVVKSSDSGTNNTSMMMGLVNVGVRGNAGNNMVGIQEMGNVIGTGGNHRISRPVAGPISGMGNSMGQNPISMNQASDISNVISQQLRSGMITPAQAAIMTTKLRMAQSRNISGGAGGQSGNNIVEIQGMGYVMGTEGNRGISPPVAGAISGSGNSMGQNPISMNQATNISNVISQQLRSGMITPAQAAIMTTKLRMAQSRNVLGGAGGQSGNITGLAGTNENSENINKP